uniref:Putative secreted protein n=1 Tax=Anopheles marajoara TaxID=58244 RepID=A0A2M4CC40_9DIPT
MCDYLHNLRILIYGWGLLLRCTLPQPDMKMNCACQHTCYKLLHDCSLRHRGQILDISCTALVHFWWSNSSNGFFGGRLL